MKIILIYLEALDRSDKYELATLGKYPTRMPLGILYLAAVLENRKHKVEIIDNALYEYKHEILIEMITKEKPDAIGFSTTYKNLANSKLIAEKIKKVDSLIKIIFGGPEMSIHPEKTASLPYVDLVVLGEGEEVLVEIFENNLENLGTLPNLVFKGSDGEIVFTKVAPPISNLDVLPFPARHLVKIEDYKQKYPQLVPLNIIASRGCPYRCSFCSLPKEDKKYRTRDSNRVVDEIELLVNKYGERSIAFVEENFAVNKKQVYEICDEIIRRKIKISWSCNTRVNNVDLEMLSRMKEAGADLILFGVESGSQRILDFLKKDITIQQIKNAFTWCKSVNISTFASFMIGIPTETKAEIFESFDLMGEIRPDQFSFQTYVGVPGTELYDYVEKNKFYSEKWENIQIISTPMIPREEMKKIEKEMNFRCNLYKLFGPLGIKLPKRDLSYHYLENGFKNIIQEMKAGVFAIERNGEEKRGIEALRGLLASLDENSLFGQKVITYLNIIIGYCYKNFIKDDVKAKEYAAKALVCDKDIILPYKI